MSCAEAQGPGQRVPDIRGAQLGPSSRYLFCDLLYRSHGGNVKMAAPPLVVHK